MTADYAILFPEEFDEFATWEAEVKGWLQGAVVVIGRRRYRVTFYDPTRLAQDIESELEASSVFFERNVIVVPSVTRAHMEMAVAVIARRGEHVDMVPEEEPAPVP